MENITIDETTEAPMKEVIQCTVVAKPDGSFVYDETNMKVLVQEADGSTILVPYSAPVQANAPGLEEIRNNWSRQEILELIELYKELVGELESTGPIKSQALWKKIADRTRLQQRTAEQAKNKFKYLKRRYLAKRRNSMAGGKKFAYFKQMDVLFGRHPVPSEGQKKGATSKSEGGERMDVEECDSGESDGDSASTTEKKRETDDGASLLVKDRIATLAKIIQKREKAKEKRWAEKQRRHEEKLARQDAALEVLRNLTRSIERLVSGK